MQGVRRVYAVATYSYLFVLEFGYVMEMSHLFAIATASSLKQEGPSKGKRYFVHEKKCRYELDKIDT